MPYAPTAAWYRREAAAHRRALGSAMPDGTPYRFAGITMTREEALRALEAGEMQARGIWREGEPT